MARGLANRAFFHRYPSGLFKAKPLVAGDVTKGERNESSLQKCFLRQGQFTRNREQREGGTRSVSLLFSATFIHAPAK